MRDEKKNFWITNRHVEIHTYEEIEASVGTNPLIVIPLTKKLTFSLTCQIVTKLFYVNGLN